MSFQDVIYNRLRSIGVNAQIAEPSLVEYVERVIGASIVGSPMSITFDIPDSPIRWFNWMSHVKWVGVSSGPGGYIRTFTRYGVPDERLSPSLSAVKITSKLKKSLLGLGRIVDMQWKGEDGGLGIIDRLNSDVSLKGPIMESRGDVEIRAYRPYGCWIIRDKSYLPSGELWNCYQAIARHLLAEWSH